MKIHTLSLPLSPAIISILCPGDKVLLTGTIYTARDQAHKRLAEIIHKGGELPWDLSQGAIFYCGPSPTPPHKICGAVGPTTSSRMDRYTPLLLEHGLKVILGKGERSPEVVQAISRHKAVYLSVIGGVAGLLSQHIVSCETFLWPELGAEAVFRLTVKDFPAYVAIT